MAMESAIVIKVKYEETLRRFNARVINEKLDLNMHGLSDKIFQLFNIARDAELILTYVDEDGDVVTLVDDEDLQDVMRQDLNPLRISVRLNAGERSSRPSSRSSGSSTPLRSPRVQPPFPNLNSSVSDVLKSVPEPLRETVMKFYSDMISRTYLFPNLNSSVSDVLKSVPEPLRETVMKLYSDLISRTYKMGLSYYQNQPSGSQPVEETSFPSGASNGNAMVADGGNSNGKSAAPSIKKNEPHTALNDVGRTAKAIESEFKYVDDALDAWVKLKAKSKALEADRTETAPSSSEGPKAHTLLVNSGEEKDKKYGACPGGKPLAFSYNSASPVPPEKSSGENPSKNHSVAKPVDMGGLASFGKLKQCTWDSCNADSGGSSIKMPTLRLVPVSANECPFPQVPKNASRLVQVPANECPFSGVPNDPVPPPLEVPLKRTHNHSDGAGTIFHRGVRCDGCGVHPITGPRFISKVKENYDLCIICFAEMGNDADYIRMDRPLTYRHPMSFKGLHDLHAAKFRIPTVPQVSRGYGVKPGRPKLDSRFIQDVNILDGTIMAPLTRFTKIWRMRNNGNLAWPQGTQLVWIGGDRLSDRFSVDLEITAGLAVDQELDVAVDFTAPEHPGRYISYWRMALSSGQKFGQRVWVLIQVDASSNLPKKELVHEAFQGLNLNLPPASNDASGSDIINVNPEPQNVNPEPQNVFPGPKSSSTTIELVDPVVDVNQNKEQEAIFPTNDSLLVGFGDKSTSPSAPSSSVSYPIIDLSEETPAVTYVAPSAAVDTQAPSQGVRGNNEIEVSLLRELEEMGFKQLDLNKEILRKNEYDLEQSVDDLCGVAEWDPILEELEEMGFSDKEMNKKLLKKNNGSIKRVVMDLIAGEQ